MEAFKIMAQTLLRNGTFTDVKLKHRTKEYRAHKIILAAHSPFLKDFLDPTNKKSESLILNNDLDPEIIDLLINYFYAFDYSDEPKASSVFEDSMQLNAAMYACANLYSIADLKIKAAEKFGVAAGHAVALKQSPLNAVRMAYGTTPSDDRGLRDICVDFWVAAGATLIRTIGKPMVQSFLQSLPQFAADVSVRATEAVIGGAVVAGKCSCCGLLIEAANVMDHEWNMNGTKRQIVLPTSYKLKQFW